jgi:hypothetical protein
MKLPVAPPSETVTQAKPVADAWGIDGGLILNPEHSTRLPGHCHAKKGGMSGVWRLELSIP